MPGICHFCYEMETENTPNYSQASTTDSSAFVTLEKEWILLSACNFVSKTKASVSTIHLRSLPRAQRKGQGGSEQDLQNLGVPSRGGRGCSWSGSSPGSDSAGGRLLPLWPGPTEGRAEPAAARGPVTCVCLHPPSRHVLGPGHVCVLTHPITACIGAQSRVCAYTPHHGTYWGPVTCACLHTPSRHLPGPGHVCVLTHPITALTGARSCVYAYTPHHSTCWGRALSVF